MKNATVEELHYHRENTRKCVLSMIDNLEEVIDTYADEEPDQQEVDQVYRFGGFVVRESYKWIDEMEENYSILRTKEVLTIDNVRRTTSPFTLMDSRCVYEFLKQTKPLLEVSDSEAVTVFRGEHLSPEVERLIPSDISTLRDLRIYLNGRFGNVWEIVDGWVTELESAASIRKGGTRSRYEALVAAVKFVYRTTALVPEVPLKELLYIVTTPE